MTKKLRTRVQFDANVLAKGQALAEEENRSVSNLIETLLKQYIAEAEANGWVYVEITNPPPRRRVERQGEHHDYPRKCPRPNRGNTC